VTINNAGTLRKSVGTGVTSFDGNTIFNNTGLVEVRTGTLRIEGNLPNSGTIEIAHASVVTVTGTYQQSNSGELLVEIAGTAVGEIGRLNVQSSATLDGDLTVMLVNDFHPKAGDTFTVMTYANRFGTFVRINGADVGNHLVLQPNYLAMQLDLFAGYIVEEDHVLMVTAPGVLGNDSDGAQDDLTVLLISEPANGEMILNADGSFTYTPNVNFNGQDSFTYRLNEGPAADPFVIDQFMIVRNGVTFFDDSFDNNIAPPDAPNLTGGTATSYSVTGEPGPEAGGKLTLNLDDGEPTSNISETGSLLTLRALLLTNIDQADLNAGIKSGHTFSVTGIFDLIVPSEVATRFGIRLSDATLTAEGNDIVDLEVVRRSDGLVAIQLRDLDDPANTDILIDQVLLDPGHDQIVLRLERGTLANNTIRASFAYVDGGVVGAFTTFANTVAIFNGENFTRAEFRASSAPTLETVQILVTAVNDAPVNSVPGPQTVNEDATLVFSAPNDNPISISDVDAGSEAVEVMLAATNGTLTLAGLTGLAFTTGDGNADATMTFSGALAAINTALNGLSYVPAENFNGPATLTITSNDQGSSGSGGPLSDTDIVDIAVNSVNDAPAGVDNTITTLEDTPYVFTAPDFGFTDPNDDPANNLFAVKITTLPAVGTLALNGTAVTAGASIAASAITAGNLTYTPPSNANGTGLASFTFQVQDDGGTANGG
jgi:hypothetical protein